jgi:hypothetical protein
VAVSQHGLLSVLCLASLLVRHGTGDKQHTLKQWVSVAFEVTLDSPCPWSKACLSSTLRVEERDVPAAHPVGSATDCCGVAEVASKTYLARLYLCYRCKLARRLADPHCGDYDQFVGSSFGTVLVVFSIDFV